MNRLDFIKSLGALAGGVFVSSNIDQRNMFMTNGVERMRIYSNSNVGMGVLNPKQILKVTNKNNI